MSVDRNSWVIRLRDVAQHGVAEQVTEVVVDRLEVVDVDDEEGARGGGAALFEEAVDHDLGVAPVVEPGQRIAPRLVLELLGSRRLSRSMSLMLPISRRYFPSEPRMGTRVMRTQV